MPKYKKINIDNWKRKSNYLYFSTFANPCYGFDVEMDITKLYKLTKERKDSFFINFLYIVSIGLNSIEEMRTRIYKGEVVVYDVINPNYTVMTECGCYDNCHQKMNFEYHQFYHDAHEIIEVTKKEKIIKDNYNDDNGYDDFYMTCIPWITYKTMTHPMPDSNPESSSVPRICWGKYYFVDDQIKILLNITVNHALCDGYPLSQSFLKIQELLDNVEKYIK